MGLGRGLPIVPGPGSLAGQFSAAVAPTRRPSAGYSAAFSEMVTAQGRLLPRFRRIRQISCQAACLARQPRLEHRPTTRGRPRILNGLERWQSG